jgi:hypothetical protein
MFFEGLKCGFRTMTREFIERMSRSELIEWLEFRGMACYGHESTELLRDTALEDFGHEEIVWDFK